MPESLRDGVIVAGAGPVGLTAALALARAGIQVTVFEKRDSPNRVSRASTFHPPTIEILDALGVSGDLLARGTRVPEIRFIDLPGGAVVRLPLSLLSDETRFPFRVHYEQASLSDQLIAALEKLPNARMHYSSEVVAASQDPAGVTVSIETPDGRHNERAAVLVASDGGKSILRESLGIGFDGEDYRTRVLRVMTREDLRLRDPRIAPICYLFDGDASMSLLQMPDCWRIILRIAADERDEVVSAPEAIRARIARFLPASKVAPFDWFYFDLYGSSRRVASTYSKGRIVLAGDAAHLTNTRGGMNMNCGIHDAWVLAQSLVAGDAVELALARYANERRCVAIEQLVPRTDRNVSAGRGRVAEMAEIAGDPDRARAWLRNSSMLDMSPRIDHATAG